ncbi:MAG: tetratricopeptide repeat protein [Candidatus Acidiferrales bacterium]
MECSLESVGTRRAVLAAAFAVTAILIFQAGEFWLANRRIDSGNLALMKQGAALTPGNGEAWDRVGRYLQFDFANPNPSAAIKAYQKAVRDDPFSSYYWIDLAGAYEDLGDITHAQQAFEHAQAVYPISALVAWNYGNFLIRRQEYSAGYSKIQQAVRTDPKLLPLAISRTWRSTENVDDLLNQALPADPEAYLQALTFFTSIHQPEAGLAVWHRLVSLGKPFAFTRTFPFLDELIADDRSVDVARAWREARAAAGLPQNGLANHSLIWNGDFARNFANGGLGWRWDSPIGVSIGFDSPPPSQRGRAVRLDFSGGSNLALDMPAEYVPVEPSHAYHFHAYIRVEDITTESGVQFSIIDPNHAGAVNVATDNLTGSRSWAAADEEVVTSDKTHFLLVRLLRNPSRLFDNKLGGTAWIADISLVPSSKGTGESPQ